MSFLNALLGGARYVPQATLGAGGYRSSVLNDEEEDEQEESSYVRPAPPQSSPEGGGGFDGRGFLASLLQSAPAMAQVFSAKSTEDIQRALADHSAVMERYRQSQALQRERATEREYASAEAEKDRAARAASDQLQADTSRENALLQQEGADRRSQASIDATDRRRSEDREGAEALLAEERADILREKLGTIQAFGGNVDPAQIVDAEGNLTPQGEALYQSSVVAREGALAKARQVEATGRQPTPEELQLAAAEARRSRWMEEWDGLTDIQQQQYGNHIKMVDAEYGQGSWHQNNGIIERAGQMPVPTTPIGVTLTETLSDPQHPDHAEMRARIERMDVNTFRAELPAVLSGLTPEAQNKVLERIVAYASPEVQAEIMRMTGKTTTRGSKIIDDAFSTVGNILSKTQIGGAIDTFRSGLDYFNEEVPK